MIKLLKIEWLKIARYRTFYIFSGLYVLLLFAIYYGFDRIIHIGFLDLSIVYKFPDVWYYAAYVSSFLAPVLGLLMINLLANEFSFRTLRQNVVDGLSREQAFASKLVLSGMLSICAGVMVLLTGLVVGLIRGGMPAGADLWLRSEFILRTIWQTFGILTAALLITLIIRRSALAILAFLALMWIIEPIIGNLILKDIYSYFPLNSLDEFIPSPISFDPPSFGYHSTPTGVMIAALIYPFVFIAAGFYLIKRKDL